MPKVKEFQLHPRGWENDPEEERFKVSTLDYLTACTYNNYCLFFRVHDCAKNEAVETLKQGLECVLAQARHYNGVIEKDIDGGHSFVKKKDSTVLFVVQWLDGPEDSAPSMDEIEEANFRTAALGDLSIWSHVPMMYGEKAEAHPDNSPKVSAFKLNLVRGGMTFHIHHHHYCNDIMGWAGFVHQLSENCYAIVHGTAFPEWDHKRNHEISRLVKKEPPEEQKIEGPPTPQRHPDHLEPHSVLFHLPMSKAAELKQLATPTDGSWISTYDAFCAFIWRHLTRIRAPAFNPDPDSNLFWSEAVDMRRRFHSPEVASRVQQNVMFAVLSPTAPVAQPTVSEVISGWTLGELAAHVRKMTNSVTQENLDQVLSLVATIKDKTAMNIRIDSQPPLSILMTDYRDANITGANFGFASPVTYRHLLDRVSTGVIIVYPPRSTAPGSDEGVELSVMMEKELTKQVVNDVEWTKYFEYRGVDAINRM